jgi:shikimate dehydrogenase
MKERGADLTSFSLRAIRKRGARVLNGETKIIAHIGHPTRTFKTTLIYNPWFKKHGINAAVVPLGVTSENFGVAFPEICRFTNLHGALIAMPHKVSVVGFIDAASTAVKVAGSCNAVRRNGDGRLIGDMFNGEGFVRGAARNGRSLSGKRVLVVGLDEAGSAIAASTAAAGAAEIALYDASASSMESLAERLRQNYPRLKVTFGSNDPSGFDAVVNTTPLGMKAGDPMPVDVSRLSPSTFVSDAAMKEETTAFRAAAQARGCATQNGIDMLFEQIPAYLEFLGFPAATASELREVAEIGY